MPIGPYADFDACRQDQMSKGHSADSADRICGAIQARVEGGSIDSNFISYELDKNGDLFLKYFFADTSITEFPTAHGQFSLDGAALQQADKEAVGLPFSILPNRELSIFSDFHPWHPDLGQASWEQHVDFARKYSPGHIVAITPHSRLEGAAQDVVANNGRFALVKITDQNAKNAYINNPALIPRSVSPGFLNYDAPNRDGIKSVKWTHLAAVPQGAYGKKATLYGSCIGPHDKCVNNLLGASSMVKQKMKTVNYCPVGASESILNTSLLFSQGNSVSKMSVNPTIDNVNSNSNTTTAPTTQPVQTTTPVPEQKKVLRLKGAVQTPQTPTNEPKQPEQALGQEQGQPQAGPDANKMAEFERRIQEMEAREQRQQRIAQVRNLIDARLFVNGNKYDAKQHEAAIQEMVDSGMTDEMISRYYAALLRERESMEALKNSKTGIPYNPLGGSYYITPSAVPEPQGGSAGQPEMDLETFRAQKVKGLLNMFGVSQ